MAPGAEPVPRARTAQEAFAIPSICTPETFRYTTNVYVDGGLRFSKLRASLVLAAASGQRAVTRGVPRSLVDLAWAYPDGWLHRR
jgi:hypothetical protein